MITAITQGIEISVVTYYEAQQSSPRDYRYIWSYNITIQNHSDKTVQLLRRHWFIRDSLMGVREVKGDGVIGQQPILTPGAIHSYTSWCPLASDIGMMQGYFDMVNVDDDSTFAALVPDFTMCFPPRCN